MTTEANIFIYSVFFHPLTQTYDESTDDSIHLTVTAPKNVPVESIERIFSLLGNYRTLDLLINTSDQIKNNFCTKKCNTKRCKKHLVLSETRECTILKKKLESDLSPLMHPLEGEIDSDMKESFLNISDRDQMEQILKVVKEAISPSKLK